MKLSIVIRTKIGEAVFFAIYAIVYSLLSLVPAHAQAKSSSSPDPFFLNEAGIRDTGNRDVNSKTRASQSVNPSIRNAVIITIGQSNIQATITTVFTPVNPSKIDNLNLYDGAVYNAVEPLNGCGANGLGNGWIGYNPALILADALITANKFDRIILATASIGGSTVGDWTVGSMGAPSRLQVVLQRLAQRGIVAGTNVTFVILWGQGEGDTALGTSQANYVASFNSLVAQATAAGFTGRWFVPRQTLALGVTSAAIQAAQTYNSPSGVINNAAGIFQGANADALVGNICNGSNACRQPDNTHFTLNGQIAYATNASYGWLQALHASGAPF